MMLDLCQETIAFENLTYLYPIEITQRLIQI